MNRQVYPGHYSNWATICKRVYLWEYPPDPSSLRNSPSRGSSDSGRLERRGNILRFEGKKNRIEIPGIEDISEIGAMFGLSDFLGLWLRYSVTTLLVATLFYIITPWGAFVWHVVGSILLGLITTVGHWLFSRKYGRCVCVVFRTSDGELEQLCFFAPPISGGSHKLYTTLLRMEADNPIAK